MNQPSAGQGPAMVADQEGGAFAPRLDDDEVHAGGQTGNETAVGEPAVANESRDTSAQPQVLSPTPKPRRPRQRTSMTTSSAGGPGSIATTSSSSRPIRN